MKSLYLAFSFSLSLIASAWATDPKASSAMLVGTWRAIAAERNGAAAPDLVGHELVFTKDRFRISRDGKLLYGGTYMADPSTQPARIEFYQVEGSTLRGEWKGIYRVASGRLEIIDNAVDMSQPWPTHFATTPGSGYVLLQFEPK
jgi:uncharacterized protein (TIGR03067 family)